jgi:hypothetical protein
MKSMQMIVCLLFECLSFTMHLFVYSGGFISFLVPSLPILYRFLQFFIVYICYFYFPFIIFIIQLNTHSSLYANINLLFFGSFFIPLTFFVLYPFHYIFSSFYSLISFFFTYLFNLEKFKRRMGISANLHDHIKNVGSAVLIFLLL